MTQDRATALVDRLDDSELSVSYDSHHTATPASLLRFRRPHGEQRNHEDWHTRIVIDKKQGWLF